MCLFFQNFIHLSNDFPLKKKIYSKSLSEGYNSSSSKMEFIQKKKGIEKISNHSEALPQLKKHRIDEYVYLKPFPLLSVHFLGIKPEWPQFTA